MDKEDKTDREKRYLERQRKELDKQREQLMKQIQERKEQSRISIQMELQKTSTPKTKDTEKQIDKDTQIQIHNPIVSDGSKHSEPKTGHSMIRKDSKKTKESHVSKHRETNEMEAHSQYLGSLDVSLGYVDIPEKDIQKDAASDKSFSIARLLADIDKYKETNPVTNVLDKDIPLVSSPTMQNKVDKYTEANRNLEERQTVFSDKTSHINTQTGLITQTDKSPSTEVSEKEALKVLTPAVPVAHEKAVTGPDMGIHQLSSMPKGHDKYIVQTDHKDRINYAPSMNKSLTLSMSNTDDDIHVPPLTYSIPLQRPHEVRLDDSIEMLRTAKGESKYIKDNSQVSQTDIIEGTDSNNKINTRGYYDMTDTHSDKEETTKAKTIKRHVIYKKDSEQTQLKEKEIEQYQDFIEKGKKMLQIASKRIEQNSDNSEDEEENLMQEKIQKLKLQARMIEEQNQRKAEEAKQMAERMRMIKLEQEKIEKERKKKQRLALLHEEEERMEKHLQLQIKQQVEEEQRLKILKEKEENMRLSLQQARKVMQESLRQDTEDDRFRQVQQEGRLNIVKIEQVTEENPVNQIERESFERHHLIENEPVEIYQMPIGKLEKELKRISLLQEQLQYEQQELDRKESERLASEQLSLRESAQREEAMLQKERRIQELEEELSKRATAFKGPVEVKSKEEILDEKEAYLRLYEEELNKKENEIRKKLDLTPIEKPDESVNIQSTVEKQKDTLNKQKSANASSCANFTHLFKPPYITRFSGTDPVPKTENTFEEWSMEVDSLIKRNEYPDYIINQAVRNSLSGQARKQIFTLGAEATIGQIKEKLENVFGDACSDESILQEFYTASQKAGESVTLWGIGIEEILQKAIQKGHAIAADQKDKMLKERFWRGLSSIELQNSTSVHYHTSISFEMLRRKVRAEEYQLANRKTIKNISKESDRKVPQINTVIPESGQAQHQPIQVDPNISKEIKDLAKKLEALDRKVNYRTVWNPRPYYPKGKGKEKGQGQSSN